MEVIIVGAGPVGCLLAVYMANRGFLVDVFERQDDPRQTQPYTKKQAVNLTICHRGIEALGRVGVDIGRIGVPVYGRLVHDTDGLTNFQKYGNGNEALISVARRELNIALLTFAEAYPNITFHFAHECVSVNPQEASLTLYDSRQDLQLCRRGEVILAADGTHSAVRKILQELSHLEATVEPFGQGYVEFLVPAVCDGKPALETNVLHFWPRKDLVLIGFPNHDGSVTLSLHMSLEGPISFDCVTTDADLWALLFRYCPDVASLLTQCEQSNASRRPNRIATVKCSPWSACDRVLLLGDAAHTIVPYYGQGTNAGFEDCSVLADCLDTSCGDWAKAFQRFQEEREPDLDTIANLSLRNFNELRDHIGDPKFLLRKEVERAVNRLYPSNYQSLYSLISFTDKSYREAVRIDSRQDQLIDRIIEHPDFHPLLEANQTDRLIIETVERSWTLLAR